MSQTKTYSELCKLECEQLLSERKLKYAGNTLKELKMLLIERGLKEAVEAKLPSGSQPQPDIDTGKLVAQALLTELILQQKQTYSKMEKHKLEMAEVGHRLGGRESCWCCSESFSSSLGAVCAGGAATGGQKSEAVHKQGKSSSPLFLSPLSIETYLSKTGAVKKEALIAKSLG